MSETDLKISQLSGSIGQSKFDSAYRKLLLSDGGITTQEKVLLLKTAVVFLNFGDLHLKKFGYRVIVRYSNLFNDYQPLYDVAINSGYIPVAKYIELKHRSFVPTKQSFFDEYFSSYIETFKEQNFYLSYGQKALAHFSRTKERNYVLVAPTSYGKSEFLISKVINEKDKKICIIVPSKALLAQTKKRLLGNVSIAKHFKRIITHPDMYKDGDDGFLAVLTQERLLRLLQKNSSLEIDLLLLDEAHNLLKNDSRSILLAQVLLILRKRNKKTTFNFFTPFISEAKNLQLTHSDYQLEYKATNESIKIEQFYAWEKRDSKVYLYDQFINDFIPANTDLYTNESSVINNFKAKKNIVYLNKPKDIESFAMQFKNSRPLVQIDLNEVYQAISEFLHPEYNLLKCIKHGIVYHHGGMPEIIRLYVESVFSESQALEFIVTNSTLLEGVNIPAEKMFLLTTAIGNRNFKKSEFKNLIGRVCRFSEVFNPETGNLRMLEPKIYILNGNYSRKGANVQNFLKNTVKATAKIEDAVENVLIKKSLDSKEKGQVKQAIEFLENIEPNTVKVAGIDYVKTDIGKLCYKNNVYDFDIKKHEALLNQNLKKVENKLIADCNSLVEAIYMVFINHIELTNEEFGRLSNISARKFYSKLLDWRTKGSAYKQQIAQFISYWKTLKNPVIYAGSKWGEIPYGDEFRKFLYVDLSNKTEAEKINLAIVRIKEEQDFVDNYLIKYVEILNDLELIEEGFYEKIKYGSSDPKIICLLKNGFSIELAKTITDGNYVQYVSINPKTDDIKINKEIMVEMERNGENPILVFEISYHLK